MRYEDITTGRAARAPQPEAPQAEIAVRDGSADLSTTGDALVNGAMILDFVHEILSYYARWADPAWIDITALWIAHTWFADTDGKLVFPATPRWMAIAPSGYGKTLIMEMTSDMSRNPTGVVNSDVTAPGVRNALSAGMTVFLDEFQRTVGTGRGKEALQSIITGGYRPGGASLNGVGGVNLKPPFGPIAIGAQPRIITGTQEFLDDIFNRSFVLMLQQARDQVPDRDADYDLRVKVAARALGVWAAQERPEAGDKLWPVHTLPSSLSSRNREISQPLLAVADRATDPELTRNGGTDLRWAVRGREAVQSVLLGSGRPDKVMQDVQEQFEIMTRKAA